MRKYKLTNCILNTYENQIKLNHQYQLELVRISVKRMKT